VTRIILELKAIDLLKGCLTFYVFNPIGLIKQTDLLAKHGTFYYILLTVLY